MESKTIIGMILLVAIASGLGYTTSELTEKDNLYYCESRDIYWTCDSFTQYYTLPNGKCINSDIGNKLCSSGWVKVTIDGTEPEQESEIGVVEVKTRANDKDWICHAEESKIDSYTRCYSGIYEGYLGELI